MNRHWFAFSEGRRKTPGFDRLNGFYIETRVEASFHCHFLHDAVFADKNGKKNRALDENQNCEDVDKTSGIGGA